MVPWQQTDYYTLLGIGRTASATEIGRAYRRAARATHPDVHPHDTTAAEQFNAVTTAYETFSNPQQRASYDRTHPSIHHDRTIHMTARPVATQRLHPATVAPVQLGRHRPRPESLQPFAAGPTPEAADLLELITALAHLIDRWPAQ